MRECTKKERSMAKENSTLQMEAFIMESFKTMKFLAEENTDGMTEKYMKANG